MADGSTALGLLLVLGAVAVLALVALIYLGGRRRPPDDTARARWRGR
ncbi:hypothetical protein [Spirillospora sp. NPDC029432]